MSIGRRPGGEGSRMEGVVREVLPNATFRVSLENGQEVTSHVAGPMRMHLVRLIPGDRVAVEITPQDLTRARIVARIR